MTKYYAVVNENGSILDMFHSKKEMENTGYELNKEYSRDYGSDYVAYGYKVVQGLDNIVRATNYQWSKKELREFE